MKLTFPLVALALCYVLFFGFVIITYDSLPVRVASHFDLNGHPNGWMNRVSCIAFSTGLALILPGFMVGLMAGIGRIPVSMTNMPNQNEWLAPEKRPVLAALLFRFGLWFACLNVLFALGLHGLIVFANDREKTPELSGLGLAVVVGSFLFGTLIWVILLARRLMQKP